MLIITTFPVYSSTKVRTTAIDGRFWVRILLVRSLLKTIGITFTIENKKEQRIFQCNIFVLLLLLFILLSLKARSQKL